MFFPVNGDLYYNSVSLLLPMTGENNGTTFTDYSFSPKTITRNGDTKISTTQSKWGNGSGYFDGTGDYLGLSSNSDFGLDQLDFTVEVWIYPSAITADAGIADFRATFSANNGTFFIDNSTGKKLAFWDGATKHGSSGAVIQTSQWTHVAVSRSGNTMRFFVNGVLDATSTISVSLGTSKPLGIGGSNSSSPGSSPFNGYMQDFRLTKGVARYTADFTLPAGPLPYRLPEFPVHSILQPSFNQIARLGL